MLFRSLTNTKPPADGSSWVAVSSASSISNYGVRYANNLFVHGQGGWSSDGLAWNGSQPGGVIGCRPIFGNGTWLSANWSSNGSWYTSSDGKNWVARTRAASSGSTSNVVFGFGFGKFVAFWSTTKNFYTVSLPQALYTSVQCIQGAYSTDAVNWTTCPSITGMVTAMTPANTITTPFSSAQIASAFTSITGIATGSGNSSLMVVTGLISTGNTNQYLVSADGVNWVLKTFPSAQSIRGIAFGGTNFVAVGTGNAAFITPTPTTALTTSTIAFNQVMMPTSADWSGVAFGNGTFVAVAKNSPTAANSTNGTTWNQQALPSSGSWNGVDFGANKFVAIGGNGTAVSG